MNDTQVHTLVLGIYRQYRATRAPLTAMMDTCAVFAEHIARDTILRDRDANPYDRQAWLYADQLAYLILARRGRDGLAGRYWQTGVQHPAQGAFLLYVTCEAGTTPPMGCAKLACAIRRGMAHVRDMPGWHFTVTDRRGRVYIDQATELSTMGELFDRAKAVRA